jgi:hypothetical protein
VSRGGIDMVSRGSLEIVSSRGIDVVSRQALKWQAGALAWQGGIDVASSVGEVWFGLV